jgi:single-strand DNA-binding protein
MTKDPELRFSPNGVAVCSFTIAVNRFGKNDEADFPNIVCFKKTAENVSNFCKKGSLVGVDGRIQTRSYDTDNGKRFVTEVVAESVQFLEPKGEKKEQKKEQSRSNYVRMDEDPFHGGGQINIQDDDLPF